MCMEYKCTKEYTLEDIKEFGSDEILKKFLKFKENINVETDPNLKWCPRNDCISYVRRERCCCVCYYSTATCECG